MRLWKAILGALLLCVLLGRAEAADKMRIGVMGFQSKVESVSDKQAEIITDVFIRGLSNSKSITIYEREQLESMVGREIRLGMSGLIDPATAVEVGRLGGIQYILTGAVTELSQKVSGATIPLFGVGIGGGSHQAKAVIDIRIIDTTTGEIKLALSETGTSTNSTTAIAFQGIGFAETEFDGIQARAISDAVNRLSYEIRSTLAGESSYVVAISGKSYTIDVGAMTGAKEGALYLVYAEGRTVRGMNGESLGVEKLPLAVLKVTQAEGGHSVCSVAPPGRGDLVRRGDKIEPISPGDAKKLKIVTSRPAASSGTFDQIFGDRGEGAEPAANSPAPEPEDQGTTIEKPEAPEPSTRQASKPARPATPPQQARTDFDPNQSTDAKVIQTYPIPSGEANMLGIRHRNAYNKYNSRKYRDAYAEFSELAEAYDGNYLAAYWAGRAAQVLKQRDDAATWFDRAIAINPNYQPALAERAKIK
ncbi:MAG: hypothetical protein LBT65_05805 [Synergistaceae bacterium]|jgi:curli biogenesis system outer membrane secretion channel CsgG|nr:hypothetical protein [Synergistaceae bacterium]